MLMVTGLHARRQTLGKSGDGGERTQLASSSMRCASRHEIHRCDV